MYFKVLSKDLIHHGYQYKLGLNIDTNTFDATKCQNGLHFCEAKDIPHWRNYGSKLAFVSLPSDAAVIHYNTKSKADRIIIDKIIDIADWEMWDSFEFCLTAVQANGFSLKFIKNQTIDICLAAVQQNGHALVYVKDQATEICAAASKQVGYELPYIRPYAPSVEPFWKTGVVLKYSV